jgi:DNA (cytosine-5)-methyltransferase 1
VIAHTLAARAGSALCAPDIQTYLPWPALCAPTLDAGFGAKHGQNNQHINQGGGLFVPAIVCFEANMSLQQPSVGDPYPTLTRRHHASVATQSAVRRLTPVECERLQGFPDNYTAIPWRGKDQTPDGPRYKALGNSMAVPVMRWIGERIQALENIK